MPCIITFDFLIKGQITCFASTKRMEPSKTECDFELREGGNKMYVYGDGAGSGWNASGKQFTDNNIYLAIESFEYTQVKVCCEFGKK